MAVEPRRRLFTVEEYYRMAESGILDPDDRVELIEGEIIQMAAIGSRHAAIVDRLTRLFTSRLGERAIVRVQNPVRLSDLSEPEPDISILHDREDFYAGGHPGPAETYLLIEVADTSLPFDRERKMPLYGRSGVPESWLVDIENGRVTVHRGPGATGYADVRLLEDAGSIAPLAFPDDAFEVGEILGT